MRKKQQPLDDYLKVNNNNKKVYFDRDSGIVTETESDIEYNAPRKTFIFSDDEQDPPHDYSHLADQSIISMKQYLKIDPKNWKKVLKHKSGTTVHMWQQNSKDEKTALFKGEYVIQGFTPQSIFYVIGMRKLWDEQFDEGKLIENLNDTTSITYESYKSTATSKAYDLTLVEKIECSFDGEILFACTSIDTPKAPKVSGKNRHHVKLQGWVLKQLHTQPVSTKVTYITQESIKGWIPGLTKKSLARKPLIIASIDHYLRKKADRLKLQQHYQPPQQIPSINVQESLSLKSSPTTSSPTLPNNSASLVPSISITNSSISNSPILGKSSIHSNTSSILIHSNNTSKDNSIILSNPPPRISSLVSTTSSSTGKHITFSDQVQVSSISSSPRSSSTDRDTPVIEEEEEEDPLEIRISRAKIYPPSRHRQERKECLDLLKHYAALPKDDWKKIGERNTTQSYMLTTEETYPLPIMKCETDISGSWTPEQICSVIQCFGARKRWDDYFEDGQVIERFSQKEYLVYTKMKSLFPIQSRDFALLSCIESQVTSGTIYIASMSVQDDLVPEQDQRTRGQYKLYGWILSKKKWGVRATLVTSLHMGGTTPLPSSISRLLTNQVPGDRIQTYLDQYGCPPYIRRVAGKVMQEVFDASTRVYRMEFVAKHAPSSRHNKQKMVGTSMWCTDIRVHTSVYPLGCHVLTTDMNGVRVDMRQDGTGLRIFTEKEELDGELIEVVIEPVKEDGVRIEPVYTWNQVVLLDMKPVEQPKRQTVFFDSITDVPYVEQVKDKQKAVVREKDDLDALFVETRSVDKEPEVILDQTRRNSNIIIISDELSFTAHQFSFIVLLMIICYYFGKFSCRCSV